MPTTEPLARTSPAPAAELGPRLLALARAAIAHHLGAGPEPVPGDDAALRARGASFVTLRLDGKLRGCIGSIRRSRALGEDVVANAVAAASRDSRFAPLALDELARTRIEVSLLSEPEFLEFSDEASLLAQLQPHRHGLMLFNCCASTTFLPQVWEQLPEPADFLAALKRKAGLRPDHDVLALMAARYTVDKWQEAPAGTDAGA